MGYRLSKFSNNAATNSSSINSTVLQARTANRSNEDVNSNRILLSEHSSNIITIPTTTSSLSTPVINLEIQNSPIQATQSSSSNEQQQQQLLGTSCSSSLASSSSLINNNSNNCTQQFIIKIKLAKMESGGGNADQQQHQLQFEQAQDTLTTTDYYENGREFGNNAHILNVIYTAADSMYDTLPESNGGSVSITSIAPTSSSATTTTSTNQTAGSSISLIKNNNNNMNNNDKDGPSTNYSNNNDYNRYNNVRPTSDHTLQMATAMAALKSNTRALQINEEEADESEFAHQNISDAVEYCEVLQNETEVSSAVGSGGSRAAAAAIKHQKQQHTENDNGYNLCAEEKDAENNNCCRRQKSKSSSSSSHSSKRRCCKCTCRDAIRRILPQSSTRSTSKSNKERKESNKHSNNKNNNTMRATTPAVAASTRAQTPVSEQRQQSPQRAAANSTSIFNPNTQNVTTANRLSIWTPVSGSSDVIIPINSPQFLVVCPTSIMTLGRFSDNAISLMATGIVGNGSGGSNNIDINNLNNASRAVASPAAVAVNSHLSQQRPQNSMVTTTTTMSTGPIVHSQVDFVHCLVPDLERITNSSFYWGKMDRYEAERLLEGKPEGTFLLRDSAQEEFLFSVTFRKYGRSLHARIEQNAHKFSFDCHDPCVFTASTVTGLLEHYKDPTCVMFFEPMLTIPFHRRTVFSLQELCRATIVSHTTYDGISGVELPARLKSYLREYHYKQKLRVKPFDEPFRCT